MSVILLFDSLILIYLFNNDRKFCYAIPFPHFKMSSPRMENENNHFEAKILIEKASNLHHSKMSLHLKTLSIFCIFIVCPPPRGGLFEVTPSPLHGPLKTTKLDLRLPVISGNGDCWILYNLFSDRKSTRLNSSHLRTSRMPLFEVTPSPLHGHSKQQNLIYGYPWSVAMEIAEYCITFSLFFFFFSFFFWGGGGVVRSEEHTSELQSP